ncbi:hypothetical protein JXR93_14210 [bacterium]|nr:hypothetical protein [bacterium]
MKYITNISKTLIILLALSFNSCDSESTQEIALDLNLKFATESVSINDLGAFKVLVKSSDGSQVVQTSNCIIPKDITSHNDRTVGFSLDTGNYGFEFQGFTTKSCDGNSDWIGFTNADIDKSKTNSISILVTKKGAITKSTLTLPAANAFFSISKNSLDNSFILTGGTNLIYTRLNRIGSVNSDTNCGSTDCVCFGEAENRVCNNPISETECTEQGMDLAQCKTCLNIENNRFTESDGLCLTPCLNSFDKNCSLHGSSNVVKIEPNQKQAKFIQLSNTLLKLTQPKIGHQSIFFDGKLFIIGGATLSQIEKTETGTLSFLMSEYSDINYIHLMKSDLATAFSTINISDLNSNGVFYDTTVVPFNDKFILAGGVLSSETLSSILSCNSNSCEKIKNLDSQFSGATASKAVGDEYVVLGGDLNNPFSIVSDGSTTAIDTDSYPNLYKAKMFYHNERFYLLGGLLFENGEYQFNTKVYVYNTTLTKIGEYSLVENGSNILSNSTLYEIEEYTNGSEQGFLIVGGLDKNSNIYTPKKGVYFVSFSSFDSKADGASIDVTKLGDLNSGRFGHSVFVDSDNKIWVAGGVISSESNKLDITNSIEIYTPAE